MFDRYEGGELAVLVHVFFSQEKNVDDLQEFESLVTSAGVKPVQIITGNR
ncbi:GTPase HflX, partial [Escherichia coli]|nr:GTPase HflX [Escherichia coli]